MALSFKSIQSSIENHPVMASVIVGGIGLVVTIYFIRKSQSKSSNATSAQNVCTDSNGNIVDCNTGLPIGTSGGFSLQPSNNNSDVLTAIGNLGQQLQNLVNTLTNNQTPSGTTNGNGGTTPTTGTTTGSTKTLTFSVPKSGLKLADIAAAFGVPLAWLEAWNNTIKPWWTLDPGTKLNIPYQGTAPTYNPSGAGNTGSGSAITGFQKPLAPAPQIPVKQRASIVLHSPTVLGLGS